MTPRIVAFIALLFSLAPLRAQNWDEKNLARKLRAELDLLKVEEETMVDVVQLGQAGLLKTKPSRPRKKIEVVEERPKESLEEILERNNHAAPRRRIRSR